MRPEKSVSVHPTPPGLSSRTPPLALQVPEDATGPQKPAEPQWTEWAGFTWEQSSSLPQACVPHLCLPFHPSSALQTNAVISQDLRHGIGAWPRPPQAGLQRA